MGEKQTADLKLEFDRRVRLQFQRAKVSSDVELRLLELRDAEKFYALVDRNRDHLRHWFDGYKSVEDAYAYAKGSLQRLANDEAMTAVIWYRGQLAGIVQLEDIDWERRLTEIGYWLGEEFPGKGIATMAVRALVEHAFTNLGFERIAASVAPENVQSRALLERLGFASEHRGDSLLYELTREECEDGAGRQAAH